MKNKRQGSSPGLRVLPFFYSCSIILHSTTLSLSTHTGTPRHSLTQHSLHTVTRTLDTVGVARTIVHTRYRLQLRSICDSHLVGCPAAAPAPCPHVARRPRTLASHGRALAQYSVDTHKNALTPSTQQQSTPGHFSPDQQRAWPLAPYTHDSTARAHPIPLTATAEHGEFLLFHASSSSTRRGVSSSCVNAQLVAAGDVAIEEASSAAQRIPLGMVSLSRPEELDGVHGSSRRRDPDALQTPNALGGRARACGVRSSRVEVGFQSLV